MTPEEFVVLDANVWIKERLFRSAVGVAFLNIISRTSLWIGLPEIVRRELLAGVVRLGNDAVNKIAPNLATIQMIVGEKPPYHLPEPEEFESAVNMRLAELAHHVVRDVHGGVIGGTRGVRRIEQYGLDARPIVERAVDGDVFEIAGANTEDQQ